MPIEVVTSIEDRSGDEATTSVWVLDASTIANLNTFAPLWATAMNDIILGVIRSVFAIIRPSITGLTSNVLEPTADIEHKGKFLFVSQIGTKVEINIPCLDEVAVNAYGSDTIDQSIAEVAAFIAAMESGVTVTGGTISPCDIGESSIASTRFARESFKNSGKRRKR